MQGIIEQNTHQSDPYCHQDQARDGGPRRLYFFRCLLSAAGGFELGHETFSLDQAADLDGEFSGVVDEWISPWRGKARGLKQSLPNL